jgi:hypothetical protein
MTALPWQFSAFIAYWYLKPVDLRILNIDASLPSNLVASFPSMTNYLANENKHLLFHEKRKYVYT